MSQVDASDTQSLGSSSMAFSMEMDPNTSTNTRKYPSIGDYYKASISDPSKPIQLQHGLSNYSNLVLGDDRISFNESILSATYRIPVEEKMAIESPSKNKSRHFRKREYEDATKKVGDVEINRLERVMKDKLFQRSYATSSPFQVRKAFKFFDREQRLKISIEGFTRALEFLGFQFSELQNTALFGRYDPSYTGDINYMDFITVAMFYPAVEPDFGQHRNTAPAGESGAELTEAPELEYNEVRELQEAELRSMWNKVDRGNTGKLNRDDFELMLMALGHHLTADEIDACFQDIGVNPSNGTLEFELFFEWWTDSMGVEAIRKKHHK